VSGDLFSGEERAFTFSGEDFGRRNSTEQETQSGSEKPMSSNPANLQRATLHGGGLSLTRALCCRLVARSKVVDL